MDIIVAIFWIIAILLVLSFPFALLGTIYGLSKVNIFFTMVEEGRAKAIMINGKFRRLVMSFSGYRFRGNDELLPYEKKKENRIWIAERERPKDFFPKKTVKAWEDLGPLVPTVVEKRNKAWEEFEEFVVDITGEQAGILRKVTSYRRLETMAEVRNRISPHEWDVVRVQEGEEAPQSFLSYIPFFGGWLSNIYWVGIYPFAQVRKMNQRWVSWDYPHTDEEMGAEKEPIPHNERIDYILVQEDIYWARIRDAETFEAVPVNINLLLTLASCNPFKSMFRIQNWVEAVTNQSEADTREMVGCLKFEQLFRGKAVAAEMLNSSTLEELSRFRSEYGVIAKRVQIQSMDPSGSRGEKYRELSTAVFEADQKAKARVITGKAEKSYIENTTGTEAKIQINLHKKLGDASFQSVQHGKVKYLSLGAGQIPVAINADDDDDDDQDS